MRFAEREHCLSDPLLVQLLAAVLRQLSKARVEMDRLWASCRVKWLLKGLQGHDCLLACFPVGRT